jgi:hypothetical protein
MTVELLVLLLALWLLAGIVDAVVLYRRRHVGWGWLVVCVLTGPLSVAVVFDQVYLAEPDRLDADRSDSIDESTDDSVDGIAPMADPAVEWPEDDPEGRLMAYGFRRMSDE